MRLRPVLVEQDGFAVVWLLTAAAAAYNRITATTSVEHQEQSGKSLSASPD